MLADVKTSRPATMIGALSAFLNLKRDDVRLLLVPDRLQQNGELVAAKARKRIARPQARLEPPRDGNQQFVAHQVAETVVDHLEAIEIEIEDRESAARTVRLLELLEAAAQPFDEVGAAAEARQRIAEARRCGTRPAPSRVRSCRSAIRQCGTGLRFAAPPAMPRHTNHR